MKIFERNSKMLVLKLEHSREDNQNGFFEEINPQDIPKSILTNKLSITGGAGTVWENFWKSNTAGETFGKYFIHIANRIKFVPKNILKLEKLNNINDFNTGVETITDALERDKNTLEFSFDFWTYDFYEDIYENYIKCSLSLLFREEDFVHLDHLLAEEKDFAEYKKFFFGRDKAFLSFDFQFPCNKNIKKHEKLDNFIKLMDSNYSIESIQDSLKDAKKQRWYFTLDEDLTFYGND